jgi:hypothetical protein
MANSSFVVDSISDLVNSVLSGALMKILFCIS